MAGGRIDTSMTKQLTREHLEQLINSGDPKTLKLVEQYLADPLNSFFPRPDRTDLVYPDQQSSFYWDNFPGVAVLLGGQRSGKSFAAGAKLARFLRDAPPPEDLATTWVVCVDLDKAGFLWRSYISRYLGSAPGEGYVESIHYHNAKTKAPLKVILKPHANGNRHLIEFKSFAQGSLSLVGQNLLAYWIDEPCPPELFNEIVARVSNWDIPGGQIYTLTPKYIDQPDLQDKYNNQKDYADHYRFYCLNTECNEYLAPGYIEKQKATNPRDTWPTILYGQFLTLKGAIWPEFNADKHVVKPHPIPDNWQRFRALDFGGSEDHPTVLLHGARSPEKDRWVVYHEQKWTNEPPSRVAQDILSLPKHIWDPTSRHSRICYCDPENRPFRNELQAAGIRISNARKGPHDVMPGISCVRGYMLTGDDGKPRLTIWDTCPQLIKEIRSYRWQTSKGNSRPNLAPHKAIGDDYPDCLRYLIYSPEQQSSLKDIQIIPREKPRIGNFYG